MTPIEALNKQTIADSKISLIGRSRIVQSFLRSYSPLQRHTLRDLLRQTEPSGKIPEGFIYFFFAATSSPLIRDVIRFKE